MGVASVLLNTVGLIFLAHAVYSAYEHSLLPASATARSSLILPASLDPKIDLPIDITLETILSVLLLCTGVVLSSPDLKPIRWHVWAGGLERSKDARVIKEVGVGGGNPYAGLEERPGFMDIRGEQKRFQEWKRTAEGKKIEDKK